MTLGETLRDLRVNRDPYRRLRQVASDVGVSFVRWSRFENDRERPTSDEMERIAVVLGGDLSELQRLWAEWQEPPPFDMSRNICHKRWTP